MMTRSPHSLALPDPDPNPQSFSDLKPSPSAHIMTPDEAESLTTTAIDLRVHDLPNVDNQQALLGKKP